MVSWNQRFLMRLGAGRAATVDIERTLLGPRRLEATPEGRPGILRPARLFAERIIFPGGRPNRPDL
jgi:hypothetical protein